MQYRGLDTETVDGKAVLVCRADAACYPRSWASLWRFLENGKRADYVVWNLTYDAQAVLAWLPRTVLRTIRHEKRATHRAWRIYYLPGKRLTLWRGRGRTQCRVDLWDCYPYYESKLNTAARKYLDAGKLPDVSPEWLSDLAPILRDAARRAILERYCRRDAELTERLWGIIESQYVSLGVVPWRAPSPATVAVRMFPEQYKMKDIPLWAQRIFRRGLYGGRSETYQRGHVGKAYAYDIHSAYPSALAVLPDPRRGEIRTLGKGEGATPGVTYGVYKVTVEVSPQSCFGPVPLRKVTDAAGIAFPIGIFTTWVPRAELDLLEREGFSHTVRWGIEIVPRGRQRLLFPRGRIEELYHLRKRNPAVNIAVKKTLNSLYGKFAQHRDVPVPYRSGRFPPNARRVGVGRYVYNVSFPTSNSHYAVAAEITARARVRLYYALKRAGRGAVSCMTDCIISRAPVVFDSRGVGLGQWGLDKTCEEFVGVGTGIYFYRDGEGWHAKRRGIPDERLFERARNHPARTLHVPIMCARSLAQAAATGYSGMNEMRYMKRALDVNLDTGRFWTDDMPSWRALWKQRQRSLPWVMVTRDVARRYLRNLAKTT